MSGKNRNRFMDTKYVVVRNEWCGGTRELGEED